jgi:hypothetical protein
VGRKITRRGKGGGVLFQSFSPLAFLIKIHNTHDSLCKNSPFLYQRKGARGID